MKKITVFLVAVSLLANFAFASYKVGVLDVYPEQSSASRMLASLSERINCLSIKSVVIGKDDLHGKNGSAA